MNKYLIIICTAIPLAILIPLGFNTIEYMCHYAPPETWYFIYPMKFAMPFWYAYMLGGIIPFASGFLFLGMILGYMLRGRRKKNGN